MGFVFLAELFTLFLLSRVLTRRLSFLFYNITHSKKWAVRFLALLFLPGTTVHELSHAVTAEILFVRARNITLLPEIDGNAVRLGSVQVEKTDFIRSFFIGTAPFIIGTSIILGIIWLFNIEILPLNLFTIILAGYGIFTISNTMFSSKKDLKGAIEFAILAVVIFSVLYVLGVRIDLTSELGIRASSMFKEVSIFLAVPLGIDIILIFLSLLLTKKI